MRKKSHISLAGYLIREANLPELLKYKKAFYFGSILPDLNPKMIKEPHEIKYSFEKFKQNICHLIIAAESNTCSSSMLWRRIGEVMHYLADYFTFPHNVVYEGSLKDHCIYEGDMKRQLYAYVNTPEARQVFREKKLQAYQIRDEETLFSYIQKVHEAYLLEEHSAAQDCRWILEISVIVLMALLSMLGKNDIAEQLLYLD